MGDGRVRSRLRLRRVPWQLLPVMAFLALLLTSVAFLTESDFRHYNSDLLYLPALFLDLREWGGRLFEWRLTPAPYFFPDMLLFFTVALPAPNIHLALTFFGIGQAALFITFVYMAGALLFPREERRTYLLFVLIAFALWLTLRRMLIWQPLFVPSEHFGVMLVAPVLLWLTTKISFAEDGSGSRKWGWLATLTTASGLIILSDQIALLQLVLPLLTGMGLLFLLHRIDRKVLAELVGALFGAVLLARIGHLLLIRYWVPSQLDIDKVLVKSGPALTALLETIRELVFSEQRFVLLILAAAVVGHTAVCLHAIYAAAGRREFSREWLFSSTFFLSMILFSLAGIVGSGNFRDSGSLRYLYSVTIIPFFSLLPFVYVAMRRLRMTRWGVLALALLLIVRHAGAVGRSGELARYAEYYPPWVACVDEQLAARGIQHGVGGYWDAKYVSVLSRNGSRIFAVFPDWTPFVKISNPEWYGRFPPQAVLFNPTEPSNFGPLDMERLINMHGFPHEVILCEERELWLYNQPEQQFFGRSFADHPIIRNWYPDGVTESFPAYALRGAAGVNEGTRIVADNVGGQILAAFLPEMPPGDYLLTVDYTYAGAESGETAVLRIGQALPEEIIWREQPLSATATVGELSFSALQNTNIVLEISFSGKGIMQIEQITMTKIGRN